MPAHAHRALVSVHGLEMTQVARCLSARVFGMVTESSLTCNLQASHQAVKLLGRGMAGDTWLFRDTDTHKLVAIKLYPRPIPEIQHESTLREIKVCAGTFCTFALLLTRCCCSCLQACVQTCTADCSRIFAADPDRSCPWECEPDQRLRSHSNPTALGLGHGVGCWRLPDSSCG